MARHSALLGRRVEVQYRAGDLLVSAGGTLVADSGKSIFLEEHFSQHGKQKTFRWEIPYQHIIELSENYALASPAEPPSSSRPRADSFPVGILPLRNRPGEA